jgi:hypothetical protein
MHKAYDRVEWCILESIMIQLGFYANWVKLIMSCVTSMKYQVWHNNGIRSLLYPQGVFVTDTLYLQTFFSYALSDYLA